MAKYLFREASAENPAGGLTDAEIRDTLAAWLAGRTKPRKILILPPDITRNNSHAGPVTRMLCELLPDAAIDVMPALGTHVPMTPEEMD
jgi:nickel-dependent lactate racemase